MKPLTHTQIANKVACPSCQNINWTDNWVNNNSKLLPFSYCNSCNLEVHFPTKEDVSTFYHKKINKNLIIQWMFYDRLFTDNKKFHTNVIYKRGYVVFDYFLPFNLTEKSVEKYLLLM